MQFRVSVLMLAFALSGPSALAGYKDDIRFTELLAELGAQVPTGAGILVGHVEAPLSGNYAPDTNHAEFTGKTITLQSGASGASSHATTVGQFFYGNTTSIAPGITQIDSFEASQWMAGGFLRANVVQPPLGTDIRIFNHSWVGDNSDSEALDILQRLDYVVETFDVLQFVGVNNGSGTNFPLLSHAFNGISVGRPDGLHVSGTTNLNDPQGIYVAGRNTPHLVTQNLATSFALPVASAAAALLLETADTNPGLSNGSYVAGGRTVQHAASSEVIKATLMAGASRDNIAGYTVNTANGLNSVVGAGQLDIFNSYYILAAGEQESEQVAPGALIDLFGFDYEPSFDDNQTATYRFNYASQVTASLVWNVDIAGGSPFFNGTATLPNFELSLFQVDAGGDLLVASSLSAIDNTENLWIGGLDPDAEYFLQVTRNDALGLADCGLAWVVEELVPGDANGDRLVQAADYTIWANNFGLFAGNATPSDGDWTDDGFVDGADYTVWANHFGLNANGSSPQSAGVSSGSTLATASTFTLATVPEPSALALCCVGAAMLLVGSRMGRRRRAGKSV